MMPWWVVDLVACWKMQFLSHDVETLWKMILLSDTMPMEEKKMIGFLRIIQKNSGIVFLKH